MSIGLKIIIKKKKMNLKQQFNLLFLIIDKQIKKS